VNSDKLSVLSIKVLAGHGPSLSLIFSIGVYSVLNKLHVLRTYSSAGKERPDVQRKIYHDWILSQLFWNMIIRPLTYEVSQHVCNSSPAEVQVYLLKKRSIHNLSWVKFSALNVLIALKFFLQISMLDVAARDFLFRINPMNHSSVVDLDCSSHLFL